MGRLRSAEWRFQYLLPPIALLTLISLSLFGYWFADREQPMLALTGTFIGWDEHIPRRGHVVWKGVPKRSCPGIAYRYIVDGEIVILPPRMIEYKGPIENEKNDITTVSTYFDLPERIKHDASYKIRIEYKCNPLHEYFPIIIAPSEVRFKLAPYMENDGGVSEDPGPVIGPEIDR